MIKTLKSRYWLHLATTITEETQVKNFCQSVPKGMEREKEKNKGYCKAFCVAGKSKKQALKNKMCVRNHCRCLSLIKMTKKMLRVIFTSQSSYMK